MKWQAAHRPGSTVVFGGDFGFRHDSSALVGVQYDKGPFEICVVQELIPTDAPLIPSEVCAAFSRTIRSWEADGVVADAHYRESIREHLSDENLILLHAPEGAIGKAEAYQIARQLLHEGKVRIPPHERLIRQIREVIARPTPGGGVSIQSPRWQTGGHGDIVSALVLALWRAARYYQAPAVQPPKEGSKEWAAQQLEARFEAKRQRLERAENLDIYEQLAGRWQ